MANPTTREELKQYCLRELGAPVINIDVADEQLEDRIDYCMNFYYDYHMDATNKTYLLKEITNTDITNRYFTIPDNIINVTRIFPLTTQSSSAFMFDLRYQLRLFDLWDLTNSTMLSYNLSMQHIRMIEQFFVGETVIRFSRREHRLYIDWAWGTYTAPLGAIVVAEAYEKIDGDTFGDIYNDRWLLRYTTAHFKRQWGSNIKKFADLRLPGGVILNGDKLYNEAVAEIDQLESDMIRSYTGPCEFYMN